MTFPEDDENGDVLALNGLNLLTEVRFIVAISTWTWTSQNESCGAQCVADPWGGVVSYVKNQTTMGRNQSGAPVLLQSGITSVPNRWGVDLFTPKVNVQPSRVALFVQPPNPFCVETCQDGIGYFMGHTV